MQYRNIPGTDLSVSLLAFGNFVFGTNWWGEFTDEDGVRLQNQAYDLGVNFFDTAPAYGNGRAEALMKATIDHAGRDNLIIASKFGYDFYKDPGEEGGHRERKQDFSAKAIRFELEQSLKRMSIDCIDLYQAHNLKLPQFTDELFDTLEAIKREGKIREWGVALGPAIGWREEGYESFQRGAATVQTVMNVYEQDPGREFCEVAAKRGAGGVIARVPTNSGMLDEEFKSENHQFPAHDHRKFRDRNWLVYGLRKNTILKPIAAKLGLTLRQFAFQWLAAQPAMVSIEPNLLNLEDVQTFAAACDAPPLGEDVLSEVAALYERDFDLGDVAHPCDLKSSTAESGSVRSSYVAPVSV
ncbi:aldo/keto reductase [Phycisphaerales bacterium AB-hyl4]|uniref:Aldo/keto reductase n=1 Tax=Natronomicrosphaera hydrolytica TaxID=3242702 RepID=A0ABV4U1V7_9BACT